MPGQVRVLDGMGHANILWGIKVIIDGHLTSKTVINPSKEITAYSTCRLGLCPVSTFNGWDHRHQRTFNEIPAHRLRPNKHNNNSFSTGSLPCLWPKNHNISSPGSPQIRTILSSIPVWFCIMLCQLSLSFSGNGMFCRHASSLN
jgi:hypothetical protein